MTLVTAITVRDRKQPKNWQTAAQREYNAKARIYFQFNETVLDNLQNRHNRPHTALRKEVVPGVLAELGVPLDTKVKWSQKAGCSCGCSPGFIIEDVTRKDVWVTVNME